MSVPNDKHRVLVVDEDDSLSRIVAHHLKKIGCEVLVAETGDEAMTLVDPRPTCAVLDLGKGGRVDGMRFLGRFLKTLPGIPVVVMAEPGEVPRGLEAIRAGAFDYVTKPLDIGAFLATVSAAIRTGSSLRRSDGGAPGLRDTQWIGQSPSARMLRETASALGATHADVLITGPTGSGKRLFARMLHHVSDRARGPLVFVPCGSIPGEALEAELFGAGRSAESDPGQDPPRVGRVPSADGGTLVLLEIDAVPKARQGMILELLQNRWIHQPDTGASHPLSLRVIATARGPLRARVEAGEFREDLYYRLNALSVQIPSLRERIEDLPHLIGIFLQRLSMAYSGGIPTVSPAAMAVLQTHEWPGNVRELESVLEWAYSCAVGGEIRTSDLPSGVFGSSTSSPGGFIGIGGQPYVGGRTMEAVERLAVQQTLELCRGNKAAAARILDVTEKTIYNKLVRLGLREPAPVVPKEARRRGRRPLNRGTPMGIDPGASPAGDGGKPRD